MDIIVQFFTAIGIVSFMSMKAVIFIGFFACAIGAFLEFGIAKKVRTGKDWFPGDRDEYARKCTVDGYKFAVVGVLCIPAFMVF